MYKKFQQSILTTKLKFILLKKKPEIQNYSLISLINVFVTI